MEKKQLILSLASVFVGALFVRQMVLSMSVTQKPSTEIIQLVVEGAPLRQIRQKVRANQMLVHERDADFRTPLWHAMQQDRLDVAQYLVSKGADIIDHDKDRVNQFMVAAAHSIDGLKLLYHLNESINSRDYQKRRPLHYAAEAGNFDTVKFLIGAYADPLAEDKQGIKASDLALENDYQEIYEYLLEQERKAQSS